MSGPALQPQIDAAKAYEALFVPALFAQYATKVLDAAQVETGQRVLDVACGTGVLAREAYKRVGPYGQVAAVDPIAGMLSVARQLEPAIDWRQGTAESIPFADESFDTVVSQFGLMFFNDKRKAIREMSRVLTNDGRLAVAVWDSLDNIPAYATVDKLLEQTAGDAAADALKAPFVLGDRNELKKIFEDSANSVEVTTQAGTAHFPSIRVMVEADLRGWLPMVGVNLSEDQISHILHEAESLLRAYASADGEVTFDLSAHIITAKKR